MNAKLDHDNALVFWDGCLGIQELFMSVLYPQDSAAFFDVAPNTLPNLHRLKLYMVNQTSSADHLVILKKTPNLLTLLLPARSNILAPTTALINILQDGYLPSLEALELSHLVEDADMALCLQAMNQVRALSSEYSLFSNLAFSNLVRHFSTLQSLDLFRCPGFTGDMIQTVLESCPLLEFIKAGTLACLHDHDRKAMDVLAPDSVPSQKRSAHSYGQ